MNNNRGNNRRRGRGNNNRAPNGGHGNGQQLNRIDSRARGNAPQLLEKYRKLAQDAHLNGDRVQAEYYLQFADHYFRVIADTRLRQEEQRARQNGGPNGTYAPYPGGVSGDGWQDQEGEDDGMDFGMDADFPTFDRPPPQQPQQQQQPRREERDVRDNRDRDGRDRDGRDRDNRERDNREGQDREYRGQRDNRDRDGRDNRDRREFRDNRDRDGRNFNRDRDGRDRDGREQRQPRAEQGEVQQPQEGVRAAEGDPIDNPFIRDSRRGPRRNDRGERRPRWDENQAPQFDPSSLPPPISIRAEPEAPVAPPAPVAEPEAAPAKPKVTRARVAKPVAAEPEAAAPVAEEAAPKKRGRPRKTPEATEG